MVRTREKNIGNCMQLWYRVRRRKKRKMRLDKWAWIRSVNLIPAHSRMTSCLFLLNQDACREFEISFHRWWGTIGDLREGPDFSHLGSSWYCSRWREGRLEAKKQIPRPLQQYREMIIRTSTRAENVGLRERVNSDRVWWCWWRRESRIFGFQATCVGAGV